MVFQDHPSNQNIYYVNVDRLERPSETIQNLILMDKLIGIPSVSGSTQRSQSIVTTDLKFQGDHDLSWVLYYQNLTDFRVPWSVINDVLQTETFKLLVFRLDMRGEEWVTAISFPQPLHLHDVVQVGIKYNGIDLSRSIKIVTIRIR